MSFIAVMLLLQFDCQEAFTIFCNIILRNETVFRIFNFDEEIFQRINNTLEAQIKYNYFNFWKEVKAQNLELWKMIWVEQVFGLFLRSFDLETSFILWDFYLVYGIGLVVDLNYCIFHIFNKEFKRVGGKQVIYNFR